MRSLINNALPETLTCPESTLLDAERMTLDDGEQLDAVLVKLDRAPLLHRNLPELGKARQERAIRFRSRDGVRQRLRVAYWRPPAAR